LTLFKSFIHGNAIVAEYVGGSSITSPGPLNTVAGVYWTDVVGLPQGWGKTYRGKAGEAVWFHAVVPTPTMVSSVRVQLDQVYVFFNAREGCSLVDLHAWDGIDNILQIGNLSVTGDQSRNPTTGVNAFPILHTMNFGLNISLHVRFNNEADITFFSAGADFLVQQ
jgi:hypothetical protein